VSPPFSPHDLDPRNSDLRELGAQVAYQFVPRIPQPAPGKTPETSGFYPDGWIGSDATYTRWFTPPNGARTVTLRIGRPTGPVPARVRITIGRAAYSLVGKTLELGILRPTATRSLRVGRTARTVTLPAPPAPFRIQIHSEPSFVPARILPRSDDTRELGVRVSFR
jgi:hypothetical protein